MYQSFASSSSNGEPPLLHYKKVQNKRTTTSVTVLKGVEKVEEISRMIAGIEVTELTKQHAKEMIEQAEKVKQTY